jgi:cytochrome o ubiquinol oxidase operon protein cyoD
MEHHTGTVRSYVAGFVLSIILTFCSFVIVSEGLLPVPQKTYAITLLALGQAFIQLVFFLHMDRESKPYWNITAFSFMVLVIAIIAIGTLWIMSNLNYNVMPHMDLQHQCNTILLLQSRGLSLATSLPP